MEEFVVESTKYRLTQSRLIQLRHLHKKTWRYVELKDFQRSNDTVELHYADSKDHFPIHFYDVGKGALDIGCKNFPPRIAAKIRKAIKALKGGKDGGQ